jgi:2-keto-4-pentenoate hydratase
MQMASKMTEPDYGHITDDMFYNDGGQIPTSRLLAPRLEVELAFIMKKALKGRHRRFLHLKQQQEGNNSMECHGTSSSTL